MHIASIVKIESLNIYNFLNKLFILLVIALFVKNKWIIKKLIIIYVRNYFNRLVIFQYNL